MRKMVVVPKPKECAYSGCLGGTGKMFSHMQIRVRENREHANAALLPPSSRTAAYR